VDVRKARGYAKQILTLKLTFIVVILLVTLAGALTAARRCLAYYIIILLCKLTGHTNAYKISWI